MEFLFHQDRGAGRQAAALHEQRFRHQGQGSSAQMIAQDFGLAARTGNI
jgi:hypothetical protein